MFTNYSSAAVRVHLGGMLDAPHLISWGESLVTSLLDQNKASAAKQVRHVPSAFDGNLSEGSRVLRKLLSRL